MRPLGGLSIAAITLTVAVLLFQVLNLALFGVNPGFGGGSTLGPQPVEAIQTVILATLFASIASALSIAQIIVGLVWFYRASDNVTRRGLSDRKWGPGWAVGAWFIPLANAILGFLAIREIWRGSQPEARPDAWHGIAIPAWINTWWGLYIVYTLAYVVFTIWGIVISFQLFVGALNGRGDPILPDLRPFQYASMAVYVAAGCLYLMFLHRVRRLQDGPEHMPAAPF